MRYWAVNQTLQLELSGTPPEDYGPPSTFIAAVFGSP